ncbi:MAG: lamin tail domain-containing protein, partial [Deltaproteobacteria bacterium]|nr:lamin tail domain-containing protein [Deltaproteobacteria bacterium]
MLLLLAACPDDSSIPLDKSPVDSGVESAPATGASWTRDEVPTPASVSFTELMYHPAEGGSEWIELHNPMSIDIDISGWSLAGGVDHAFPSGTVIPAGEYLVVTPAGELDDAGERVELRNNGGRLIDTVAYLAAEPWPEAPDGSGVTLAKRSPELWSDHAENWTWSPGLGGTPGAANGLDDPTVASVELVAMAATWRYHDSGSYPSSAWAEPSYDDSAWAEGEAVFYAGAATGTTTAIASVTADNYYGVYVGSSDGSDLRLVGEDPDGDWTTVEDFEIEVGAADHLYLAAWEADWDYGGPQMTIAEVDVDGEIVGTSIDNFEYLLGPSDGYPGVPPGDAPPPEAELASLAASGTWAAPSVEADRSSDPWGWANSGYFSDGTQYVWADTFSDTSVTNTENTYALFRSVAPLRGGGGNTELSAVPTTTLFRTRFALDASPASASLYLSCELDDGAVIYLNGTEVHRENMPSGAVDEGTEASAAVDEAELYVEIDKSTLVEGENVLAVEVHQAGDDDLRFGCALSARVSSGAATPSARFNEVTADWIELSVAASDDVALAWPGGDTEVPAAGLDPGELQVLEGPEYAPGDMLFLYDASRATLLDAVRVADRPRARDEAGQWRYATEPTPGEPNIVDIDDSVVIHEIMYHHPSTDEEWIELYNRGEVAVDLSGWQIVDAVAYTFPEGSSLAPGELLVVSDFSGRLDNTSDRIVLLDASGNPADEVRYFDDGRWPSAADGGGSSLELRDPRADNAAPEAWAASDESGRAEWQAYTYTGIAEPSAVGPDGTWNELVIGLLDQGEVLVDDLSVDRDGVELVQNGSFDDDSDHWRLLGNHRHSEVIPDPDDPGNSVLRLVATGPTGHMHNHAESTLREAVSETTYTVSFRARWVSGSNQLNHRLYFNRMPVTTAVATPGESGTPGEANSTAAEIGPTFGDLSQDIAVPAPYQPVAISVDVADRDGVESVLLWTSVDGAAFGATEMTASGNTWSGAVEGQAAGTIVQLYVEAEDGLGDRATFPAAGPDSRALLTFDGGEAETNGLHNLRILVTGADSDWMHDDVNLMSDDLLGATVIYDESEVYYDVGIRLKGSERGRPEDVRLGYALRFNGYQPFRGSHRGVLVDRSEGVNFGQREVLMNLAMTAAGSVSGEYNDLAHAITPLATHTGPVELQLDRASGLVLASQFEDGDQGSLFEYELIYYPYTTDDGTAEGQKLPSPDSVVGTAITDLGSDKENWRWNFLLSNNQGSDDFTGIMALGQAFDSGDFPLDAGSVIDVDQWLRAFAFATLSGAVDNYGSDGSQHNARFYQRPGDGLMLYFPHDLDFFGSSQMSVIGNGDLSSLLTISAYERLYYGHLQDIIRRAYNTGYLGPWCDQIGALLPAQDFASHCQFIDDRADWVMSGSPDAVHARFPEVGFAVTTADFSTAEATADLEGTGWIDVRSILVDGTAIEPEWTSRDTWRVSVPLEPGANTLELVA